MSKIPPLIILVVTVFLNIAPVYAQEDLTANMKKEIMLSIPLRITDSELSANTIEDETAQNNIIAEPLREAIEPINDEITVESHQINPHHTSPIQKEVPFTQQVSIPLTFSFPFISLIVFIYAVTLIRRTLHPTQQDNNLQENYTDEEVSNLIIALKDRLYEQEVSKELQFHYGKVIKMSHHLSHTQQQGYFH